MMSAPAPGGKARRFWPRWLTVPRPADFVVGSGDNPYLLRWYVVPRNRFFGVYLHRFMRSDDDRALHDHPKDNVSLILSGQYREHFADGTVRLRRRGRVVARCAETAHRIELIDNRPAVSLFLTGPMRREWGFLCPQGWRHWSEFVSVRDGGNDIGRGCE